MHGTTLEPPKRVRIVLDYDISLDIFVSIGKKHGSFLNIDSVAVH